jgi:hypothetical protein
MTTQPNAMGPPSSHDENGPDLGCSLARGSGRDNREAPANPQAALDRELPPEIEAINDLISEANDAISSAWISLDDAGRAIERADWLREDWNAAHPDQQLDEIEELDIDDMPSERPLITLADLDPPDEHGADGEDDDEGDASCA